MKTRLPLALTLLFSLAAICSAADSAIEKTIRDLDSQWAATVSAKDLDKLVSYYSSDAIVLAPNAPAATTPAAVRAVWKEGFDGLVSGGWKATRVEVAKSGDMAWVTGTYDWVTKDESGKTVTDKGKFLEVFAKQADGTWKCTADAWNSDLPAEPAEKD
ncbi:MAG: DUF4440 domain-containing protein [Verrucomicrobiota bacterium]|nr:DUF4440 domain-containing protein [Verrucomicrobiota bacterium]